MRIATVLDLDDLLDRVPVGLVQLLGVQFDVGLGGEELYHSTDQDNPLLNIVKLSIKPTEILLCLNQCCGGSGSHFHRKQIRGHGLGSFVKTGSRSGSYFNSLFLILKKITAFSHFDIK